MTETPSADVITQALELIYDGLGTLLHRELISSSEVTDLLLDVRTLLSTPSPSTEAVEAAPVPVG